MKRNIIDIPKGATAHARYIETISVKEPTLIKGSGLRIGHLIIEQPLGLSGRDRFLCELRGSECEVGKVTLLGTAPDQYDRAAWNERVVSGLLVTGHQNTIGQSINQRVHIPYLVTGLNNKLAKLYAELVSGDGFNLCNHGNDIYMADFVSLISTFPYDVYHPDIGMMYHKDGLTLQDCRAYNVRYYRTGHRWEDDQRQGFLSDHKTVNCGIYNFQLPDVHPEHGCSWADASHCTTMNLETNGLVNFDRKSSIKIAQVARENVYV